LPVSLVTCEQNTLGQKITAPLGGNVMKIALRSFIFLALLTVATANAVQAGFAAPAPGAPAPPTLPQNI
jgi:hypothetical protein